MYKRISVSAASELILEKAPLIFDVRDPVSYQAGHIPNAIYLTDQKLKATIKRTPRHRTILIYCYHGNASRDIARLFADFGFTDVYSMDGGFESWSHLYREIDETASVAAEAV